MDGDSRLVMLADIDVICLHSRPASDLKKKEMTGSGIFNGAGAGNGEGNNADRTAVRMHQVGLLFSFLLIRSKCLDFKPRITPSSSVKMFMISFCN